MNRDFKGEGVALPFLRFAKILVQMCQFELSAYGKYDKIT